MDILLVTCHPRPDSLSNAIALAFAQAATGAGHRIEVADLAAEGFDPRMPPEDEPDWDNPARAYSPQVQAEWARIRRTQATVMVFPVWWWSVPALLKGWIDRVWNNGLAYGDGTRHPHQKALMLAIAGGGSGSYAKRGYDTAMKVQLETGILNYCGIPEAHLQILYDSFDAAGRQAMLAEAARLGQGF